MAKGESAADSPSAGKTTKDWRAIPRNAAPYFVAALLAAVAMGWYFFVFVPQKLEYFVGLRFRTLAVASGQIKGKAESLGASLTSAPPLAKAAAASAQESVTAKYLRLLIPEIRLGEQGGSDRPGLQLLVNRPAGDPNENLRATVAWDQVAAQGAAASAPAFDDLVVADKDGNVLWQRETTTPRLGNLTELLYAEDDKGTLMSPSWAIRTVFPAVDAKKGLPKTAAMKAVRIGTTSTLMLVQAVQLESPQIASDQKTLYVAGFVSRGHLQRQAMRIPLAWLVVVWLPVAMLFLALPFIKLATMQAKERFSFVNLILLAIGTIAAASLGAAIPVGPRATSGAGDALLAKLATLVDEHLGREASAVLALAKAVAPLDDGAKGLDKCEVPNWVERWKTERPCDLWGADALAALVADARKGLPELDVVVWLDDRGEQLRKWTTKAQLTGPASHRAFEHFRALTSGSLWSVRGDSIPFTIEPLRAPTTAELGVVFAMPLKGLVAPRPVVAAAASAGAAETAAPRFLALNVRPHAVVDAVMPPGYEFAIVAPEGRVLFHSNDGLSLEENFFEEVSNGQSVRERMQAERAVAWSGDYHGMPHRIHVQPVRTLQGSRWRIVVLQDLSPALAALVEHQSGTFKLAVVNLGLLSIVALFVWGYLKFRGRDVRDLLTAAVPPDPVRLSGLVVLIALAAVAFAATSRPPAHQWANVLYGFFVLLPFAAVGVSVYSRIPGAGPSRSSRSAWLSRLELGMIVLLVGAMPAAGFARIVHRVQDARATERWLEFAHQRTVEHASRAAARAVSPRYPEVRRAKLRTEAVYQGGANRNALHFYVAGSPLLADVDPDSRCEAAPETGQVLVRKLLDWKMFSSERPGEAKVGACPGSNRLQISGNGVSLAAMVWPDVTNAGSGLDWERGLIALLILAGTIGAAYWARHRLKMPSAVGAATFQGTLNLISSDGNQGIMLVGPPRTRKDTMIKDAIFANAWPTKRPTDPETIYRVKLLDIKDKIDDAFIKTTNDEVLRRSKLPALLDEKKRLWIHVSNLETQLISEVRRTAVLELLEKLLERPEGDVCRVVVVTTSIDPVAHFHEIFTKECEDIYDDEIPEVKLSRSSLLLSRFRRCYLPIDASRGADPWWNYDAGSWQGTLQWEAASYPPLVEVSNAVIKAFSDGSGPRPSVTRSALARTFRSHALASYDLLWESCTRSEKIVMIQLAQEGFITTENCEVVWGLINKGLIVERPHLAIFNNSFRSYLRNIEHDHVIEQWEREDGNGLWMVAGRLIGSSLIAGGLFYLTTQDFSVDSLLPVVSGTGIFGAPALRALLARVTMRGAAMVSA